MTQLKYLGKINEVYCTATSRADGGWVDEDDETKIYELLFYVDPDIVMPDVFNQYNELDKFHVGYEERNGIPCVIADVAFSEPYDYVDEHVFFIDTVKKEIPEILLEQYGIVATPQEYELPEGEKDGN